MNNNVFQNEELTRFQTAYNLTSIVNKMTGLNAFVISNDVINSNFQFNVNGYCFTVSDMKSIIDKLRESSKTFINVRVVMRDGYLYDKDNNFVGTSIVNVDEAVLPIVFETSQTPTYTLKKNKLVDNVFVKSDYCIKKACVGCDTYSFTIVEKVKNGDKIEFKIPRYSKIDNDESLLGLELARTTNGVIDDGEL